jgi:3',5'-nucleoside bisphosphate phosphatase
MLGPRALAERAAEHGVTHWALTDHDTLGGLEEAGAAATRLGLVFVPGVEISASWRGQTLHVVGLGIDPQAPALIDGLAANRAGRHGRAARIAEKLAGLGIPASLEGALARAEDPELISRTHFARFLVDEGRCADLGEAFARFLGAGRPAYVAQPWAELSEAVGWIIAAGGVAVLAHPGRYRLSAGALGQLIGEFAAAGGRAIEVVTGSHSPDQFALFAALATQHGLLGSRGSDFHGPGLGRCELGAVPPLPASVSPVWRALPQPLGARG